MKLPQRARPVTQADVSADCGLSEMTVSRVLRGAGGVTPENAARVQASARRFGYVANRIAGALAGSSVPLVAVIAPSLADMVFPEVLMGLSEGLAAADLQLVLGLNNYCAATEERVLAELLAWRPAGVVLTGLDHSAATRAHLARAGLPVVEIMDSAGPGIDCILGLSHREAGRQLAEAVANAGYRNAALLSSSQQADRRQDERHAGFAETLAARGVPLLGSVSYQGTSSVPKGHALAVEALRRWPEVEFLCCTNDMIAAGAYFGLTGAGCDVPGQVGLSGFGGLELLDGLPRRVATIDIGRYDMGHRAARMLADRLAGAPPGQRQEIGVRFSPGETLRPYPVSPGISRVGTTVTS